MGWGLCGEAHGMRGFAHSPQNLGIHIQSSPDPRKQGPLNPRSPSWQAITHPTTPPPAMPCISSIPGHVAQQRSRDLLQLFKAP